MKSRISNCFVRPHIALIFLSLSIPTARAELDIVVPAYFYPTTNSPWNDLNAVASQAKITAIMNPDNGPGMFQDSNYVAAVNSFRTGGGRVIGYVHTSFGTRPLSVIQAEIDTYLNFYNIDGIFVDEMANTGPAQTLNYYRDLYNYVKGIDANWEVMGNPGTTTIEQYLTWPTADRLVVFEDLGSTYPAYTPSSWNFDYDSSKFVHLVHSESSGDLLTDLNLAVARNAGGIYITDDVLPNPWDKLPTYWSAEVAAVAQINSEFLDGDFNENGIVDAPDLSRWIAGYGTSGGATRKTGDADHDGDVDGNDFLTWQRQLGQSSILLPTQTKLTLAVPEPSSSIGLFTIIMAIPLFRATQ